MTEIRKGQAPAVLSRSEFHQRFIESFMDPAFRVEDEAISRVEAIAWQAYEEGRKSPVTRKAGPATPTPTTTCRSNGWRPKPASKKRRPAGVIPPAQAGCY
jgi:hypothetical protein